MRAFLLVALSTLPLVGCGFGLTLGPDDAGVAGVDSPADESADPDGSASDSDPLPSTAVELDGMLYAIDPATMHVVEPEGLDALFGEVLDRDVFVYVVSESSSSIELAVALAGVDGRQDACEAVRRFPSGDWTENPVFDVGPGELSTQFGGHPASFRHLELSGVFDENASAWRNGVLSAELDTRELAAALPSVPDLCAMVEDLGGVCGACDDGEPACFTLRIEDIVADAVDVSFEAAPDDSGCP